MAKKQRKAKAQDPTTEAGWLDCTSPGLMLEFLDGKSTERKARLFCCACCRRIWDLLPCEELRRAVEIAEDFPDDRAKREEAMASLPAVLALMAGEGADAPAEAVYCAGLALPDYFGDVDFAFSAAHRVYDATPTTAELARQSDLLRDIYGNPFRLVVLDPAWLNPDVVALARAAYDHRLLPAGTLEPERLALLADALEDAGCTQADLLDHLRGEAPHVRGCWPVDLLLGKE